MAHSVDIHVGKRLRHRRWMLGMTQGELANALGIRFQQIQKYESGANRVSASRLWDIAQVLEVPIAYFFQGLEGHRDGLPDELLEAETLIQFYRTMPDDERRRLREMAAGLRVPVSASS
ncbi:transcriptional regulator with XRE-family HTH domain [Litoreibacter halocynthiae]|uniref:Transcriptional regulator with XRE-family HTH domain n=1 Tax=Litoreibacter halocynthiae TaxID=1242689 RepID=A0A4R7LS96_9RHOB|nr:helix-turn-helix transcriptional regulator [Litoreibacter halocynthiae]TDT77120.1 transcriptional regulator with XRE-family HTH domain [Litoreibacter halocynthiae]